MDATSRKRFEIHPQAMKELRACPDDVKDVFGSAILDVQYGDVPDGARPFGEGIDSRVWKLSEDHDGDTYRAAYTIALPGAVYVLHVFKKKSVRGSMTPRPVRELVRARLAWALHHHRTHYEEGYRER